MVHVSLEVKNEFTTSLWDFVHPEKCVYVTGNTNYHAPAHVLTPKPEILRVHVEVPGPKEESEHPHEQCLYGFQVLPIVLMDRIYKNGTVIY